MKKLEVAMIFMFFCFSFLHGEESLQSYFSGHGVKGRATIYGKLNVTESGNDF